MLEHPYQRVRTIRVASADRSKDGYIFLVITHLDDAMVIATAAGAPDGKTASVICRTRKLVDAELRDVIEHARDADTRLTYRRPGYAMRSRQAFLLHRRTNAAIDIDASRRAYPLTLSLRKG